VKAERPKEAVLMYVHAQDWDAAQRVAEAHDAESTSDVMVGQARVAFQSRDYPKAEMFLLRANRPELAIRYYKEAGMWEDALRLAQEYNPTMLPELRRAYEQETGGDGSLSASPARRASGAVSTGHGGRAILQQARTFEGEGNHRKAVDAYLKLQPGDLGSGEDLQEAYEHAAELAVKFLPAQASQVTQTLCQRLVAMGKHGVAADLLIGVDMLREAVAVCLGGNLFPRAKALAQEMEDPELLRQVQEAHVNHLQKSNAAGEVNCCSPAARAPAKGPGLAVSSSPLPPRRRRLCNWRLCSWLGWMSSPGWISMFAIGSGTSAWLKPPSMGARYWGQQASWPARRLIASCGWR
jgi:intraflagellar transport protein 172